MAKVTNSVSTKYRVMGLEEDEAPLHDNTEGEQLIKDLVKKQTSTQTSLTEQLSLHKQFVSSTELVDLAIYPQGECSFKKFSDRSKHIDQLQEFKRHGLSDPDIQIALDLNHGEEYVKKKYKKIENAALNERLAEIKKTLEKEKEVDNKLEDISSRHEKELQSIEPQSESMKLLQYVNICKNNQKKVVNDMNMYPHDHPMNSLPSIEHELFDHLKKKNRKRKRGKKPEQKHILTTTDFSKQSVTEIHTDKITSSGFNSQWDNKEAPFASSSSYSFPSQSSSSSTTRHIHSCSPQTWYTIEKNRLVFLGCNNKSSEDFSKNEKNTSLVGKSFVAPASTSVLIPMGEILSERLSVEEIKQMPKFSNYQEGDVSKTIFVKNLASCVKEADLVRLFGHFEDLDHGNARIIYRLMGGKMKGQAFITFPSIDNAQKALNTVNGFKLKGRAIILQFGKKNS